MNDNALRQTILAFLAEHHVLTLATCSSNGVPRAASLMYANQGFSLYWVSDPETRHSRDLVRELETSQNVAATIAPDYDDFTKIRGLQIEGYAVCMGGALANAGAMKSLVTKFGFFKQFMAGPAHLAAQLQKAALYRLDCKRIVLIDNTVKFGHRDVLELT